MEAEMRSLGIDPEAAMQQVAEALGGRNQRLDLSKHPALKAYFKTPRLQELYEYSKDQKKKSAGQDLGKIKSNSDRNKGHSRRGVRRLTESKKRRKRNETGRNQFDMSVTHQACNYVQDTATLQRDLQCAFGSPHRVKEVMILRCAAYMTYVNMMMIN
jgi:hypothetical protein